MTKRTLRWTTISCAVALLALIGCGPDSDGGEEEGSLDAAAHSFGDSYASAVSFDSGLDFENGTTIAGLAADRGTSGSGELIGVRSDIVVNHGPGDVESLLVFEIDAGEDGMVLLALPGSSALDLDELDASLAATRPLAYYVGADYRVAPTAVIESATGEPTEGRLLAVPTVFPLVLGVTGEDVATSLTSSQPIPATRENLDPLIEAGLTVTRIDSTLDDSTL